MALERLYYNDPFSNIIISFELIGNIEVSEVIQAIKNTIVKYDILGTAITLNESNNLKYNYVGHKKNLGNIKCVSENDEKIVKTLARSFFILEEGDTIKIIINLTKYGFSIYFCVHHIIADGVSVVTFIKHILSKLVLNESILPDTPQNTEPNSMQVDLGNRLNILIKSIDRHCSNRIYSRNDYYSMFTSINNDNELDVVKYIIEGEDFFELKKVCHDLKVSINSYLIVMVFENQDIEMISIPVNLRCDDYIGGNYIGQINIDKRIIMDKLNFKDKLKVIDEKIKRMLQEKHDIINGVALLDNINPSFFDDIIYDKYSSFSNPGSMRMNDIIGYRNRKKTTFISNLKTINLPISSVFKVKNLFFYPPAVLDRIATMGVVSLDDQMSITVQNYKSKVRCKE